MNFDFDSASHEAQHIARFMDMAQDCLALSFDDWVNKQYVNGTLSYVERAVDDAVNVAQPTTSTSPSTTTSAGK